MGPWAQPMGPWVWALALYALLCLLSSPTPYRHMGQIIAQSSCESEIIAATYGANEASFRLSTSWRIY